MQYWHYWLLTGRLEREELHVPEEIRVGYQVVTGVYLHSTLTVNTQDA